MELTDEEKAVITERRKASKATVFEHVDPDDTTLETPKPAAKVAPGHSAFVVQMAKGFGFRQEDIDSMSPDTLETKVAAINDHRMRQADSALKDRDALPRYQPPAPTPPPVIDSEDADLRELGLVDKDRFDPELLGILKNLAKRNKTQVAELQGKLAETEKANQQSEQARVNATLDQLFSESGRENLFGKGPLAAVQGTPAARRRVAVFKELADMRKGLTPETFREAVETLYGKKKVAAPVEEDEQGSYAAAAAAAPKKRRPASPTMPPDEGDFEDGIVARPTSRKGGREPRGTSRAERGVKEKMDELGMNDEDFDTGDLDGFLPSGR